MATSVRLSEETTARLDKLAAETGRSRAYYLRELIESGLDRLEWQYRVAQEADDIRAGRARTYSQDDVRHELGLDD